MTTDTRSSREIERDIERNRSDLSHTLDEIQSRFTPEAMVNEVVNQVRTHGGEMGASISRSVKQNPMALALTGVGLAWLIFGRSQDTPRAVDYSAPRRLPDYGEGYAAGRDWGRAGESPAVDEYPTGRNQMSGYRDYPEWYALDDDYWDDVDGVYGEYDDHDDGDGDGALSRAGQKVSGGAAAVGDSASRAGSAVGGGASRAGAAVSGAASKAGSSVSDTARRAGAGVSSTAARGRDGVKAAYASSADRAARMRARLSRGTEHLTEAGRERVIAARQRAVDARRRASETARRGWSTGRDTAVDFFEEQPLVAGALALAVGAALAASLPRTRYEDETFGEQSDALMAEAERVLNEEMQKAKKVAAAVRDEAETIAKEKGGEADDRLKDTVDKAKKEVEDASKRVKDTAQSEAEKQNLGKPNV
jgi:hypothetical protein